MTQDLQVPLVSVLMTAYNRENYIGEAIGSVLASTYTNIELIITDDGSKDATVSIAKMYAEKDPRIRVYINPKNLGDYPNRNSIARKAKGNYLLYVDSDDSITPDAIEYLVGQFQSHPKVQFSLIYNQDDISEPVVLSPKESIHRHFFVQDFLSIGPGGSFMTRDFFTKMGGYPEKYGPANDMYWNLRAASNTDILLLPYQYLNYRIHDGQELNNKESYLYNNHRILIDALNLPEIPLTDVEKKSLKHRQTVRTTKSMLKYFLKTGNLKKTIEVYKKASIEFKYLFS